MKKIASLTLALCLGLSSIGIAQADGGRHGGYGRHHHHHRHHGGGSHWGVPAALLAITGLAIGAAAYSQANAAPVYAAPVYSPPPRPVQVQPETGSWYYCASAGQYYPYVRYCQEGWQAVMPPQQ